MLAAAQSTASMSLALQAGGSQRLLGRGGGDLGHQLSWSSGRGGETRVHARRVQHAGLVHHVALLDARGLLDELGAGGLQRRHLAGADGLGVLGVEALDVGVEGLDQLLVADAVRRQHDPEHKQLLTGSRIAYKGRGGPDAVKTASRESMKEQMRSVVESRPLSN
jgi:hypothetical protein